MLPSFAFLSRLWCLCCQDRQSAELGDTAHRRTSCRRARRPSEVSKGGSSSGTVCCLEGRRPRCDPASVSLGLSVSAEQHVGVAQIQRCSPVLPRSQTLLPLYIQTLAPSSGAACGAAPSEHRGQVSARVSSLVLRTDLCLVLSKT